MITSSSHPPFFLNDSHIRMHTRLPTILAFTVTCCRLVEVSLPLDEPTFH
eukprot:m.24299 g.24299  ORF g.24299 m.24299 type:complete len:50 (-) comp4253_c0_seq1:48-197(-)